MIAVYIAGPYRASTQTVIDRHVRRASKVGAELCALGYAALVPHSMTAHWDDHYGVSIEAIMAADFELLGRCDVVLVLPGWEASEGTKAEIAHAEACGIPVYYSREELLHGRPAE